MVGSYTHPTAEKAPTTLSVCTRVGSEILKQNRELEVNFRVLSHEKQLKIYKGGRLHFSKTSEISQGVSTHLLCPVSCNYTK